MSRGDWVSIFATLTITGLAYYLSGPKLALGCVVLGIIGLIIMHDIGGKEKARTTQADGIKVKDSFNPTFSQTGPTIQIGYPAPPPPSVPPLVLPEDPKSNIIFLHARQAELEMSGYEGVAFHEVTQEGIHKGLLACFRNEAIYGKPCKDAIGLRAHLRFFDKNDQEIGIGVSGAVWIGSKLDTVNLAIDDSRCVLIMHNMREHTLVHWKERQRVDMNSYSIRERNMPTPKMADKVQVRLTAGHEQLLPPVMIDLRTLKRLA